MMRFFDDPLHLVVLLVVILIVFGAGKLPSVGSALGQSIKEFKKASVGPDEAAVSQSAAAGQLCPQCSTSIPAGAQFCPSCGAAARPQVTAPVAATVFCPQCGANNGTSARFCAQCGSNMSVRAS